jgi:Flp pilus assembly protein TadG
MLKPRCGYLERSFRRGSVLVQMAMIMVIFTLLIFGFIEHARLIFTRQLLENAAREGARQALVSTGSNTTADIQATVNNYLGNAQLKNTNIQVYQVGATGNNFGTWNNTPFGTGVGVQIDADYYPMVPTLNMVPNPLHMQVKSFMICEAN